MSISQSAIFNFLVNYDDQVERKKWSSEVEEAEREIIRTKRLALARRRNMKPSCAPASRRSNSRKRS